MLLIIGVREKLRERIIIILYFWAERVDDLFYKFSEAMLRIIK